MKTNRTLSRRASKRGFTLVEIGVVVAIIGLLAALALPGITKTRRAARAAAFINDTRSAGQMFAVQAMSDGVYPDSSGPGIIPEGMEEALSRTNWTRETPMGGQWRWEVDSPDFYAGIVVENPTEEQIAFLKIDARIDDGDLTTGTFRSTGTGYVYIIE